MPNNKDPQKPKTGDEKQKETKKDIDRNPHRPTETRSIPNQQGSETFNKGLEGLNPPKKGT